MITVAKNVNVQNYGKFIGNRGFTSSRILDKNVYGLGSKEIYSTKINAKKRQYFVDLKASEDSGEVGLSNALFVKISEREKNTGKRSSILLGFGDLPECIESMKQGLDPESLEKKPDSYKSLPSKLFEHKSYKFFARENDFGRYLTVHEIFTGGVRMDTRVNILIPQENLQDLIDELEIVLSKANERVAASL